jgi:glucan-binding YG repeat protein
MNSPTSITATSVIFNNSNVSDIINQDTTKTYYLTADVNLNTSKTNVSVSLDQTNSKVQSNNGVILDITPSTSAITSNIHRIEENNAIIAKTTNTSKDLNISAVRFSISAIGKNQAIISNITIKTNLTGYTGATDISIYKDTISNINLV